METVLGFVGRPPDVIPEVVHQLNLQSLRTGGGPADSRARDRAIRAVHTGTCTSQGSKGGETRCAGWRDDEAGKTRRRANGGLLTTLAEPQCDVAVAYP